MPFLESLPVEICGLIADELEYASEVNALCKTCRSLHGPANRRLYAHFAKDCSPRGFKKLLEHKNVDALRKVLPALMVPDEEGDIYVDDVLDGVVSGEGEDFGVDKMEKLLATIQIFTDLYGQRPAFHEIAKPEFADAVQAPADLEVLDVLSMATSWSTTRDAALWAAAKKGSLACVNFLLKVGGYVDAADQAGQTALMRAAEEGHLHIVKHLHQAEANINHTTPPDLFLSYCRTPLFNAAMEGHDDVVRYLLENGAHLGTLGHINPIEVGGLAWEKNALPMAKLIMDTVDLAKLERLSSLEMIAYLCYAASSGDETAIKSFGHPGTVGNLMSPLLNAAKHGHSNLVNILLDQYAEFPGPKLSEDDCIELMDLAGQSGYTSVVNVVLDYATKSGIPINYRRLFLLVTKHRLTSVSWRLVEMDILDKKNDERDEQDYYLSDWRDSPVLEILNAAIEAGEVALTKHIIDKCGLPTASPTFPWYLNLAGCSVLEMVAGHGSFDTFREVIGSTAFSMAYCPDRALLRATSKGSTEIVSYFLQHGCDVNGTYSTYRFRDYGDGLNDYGNRYASDFEEYDSYDAYRDITLLIQSVIPCSWDDYGSRWKPSSMTEFLLDHGAKVDTVGSNGRTALAEVARNETDISLAKLLIERGANPLIGFGTSQSALEYAVWRMNPEMVELFMQTIAVLQYQCVGMIQYIRENLDMPRKEETYDTKWWRSFFVVKALKQYFWRSKYPSPGSHTCN